MILVGAIHFWMATTMNHFQRKVENISPLLPALKMIKTSLRGG
ncbi:hypothetical protein BPUTEOMOX_630 [methanotrophic endosymbiont of Bathymodiolus puteoserpentis (Logatchev)]|nr:hypothetical protein BPUTEOMOX_630 [methanotrophic endosymbiont of Bathymodiolus puteoserpentis (Logatchev)]